MLRGVFIEEKELKEIEQMLDAIKLEVSSAICFKNNQSVVLSNMNSVNRYMEVINSRLGR